MVKPVEWRAIIRIAEGRPRPEQLVERQRSMEYIAARQPEHLLEIEWGERLPADNARLESRRIALDRLDHEIGHLVAMIIPGACVGQSGSNMLAEEACDMRPSGRERLIEGRRNDHLDDRLAAPTPHARVAKSAIHVCEARRKDDAGRMMILHLLAGSGGKAGKLGERNVHAKGAGAAAPGAHTPQKARIESARRHKSRVE